MKSGQNIYLKQLGEKMFLEALAVLGTQRYCFKTIVQNPHVTVSTGILRSCFDLKQVL